MRSVTNFLLETYCIRLGAVYSILMPSKKTPEIIGTSFDRVEFWSGDRRVVAFADGTVQAHDDETVTDLEPTDLEVEQAKMLLKTHLRKHVPAPAERAMRGPGVDY